MVEDVPGPWEGNSGVFYPAAVLASVLFSASWQPSSWALIMLMAMITLLVGVRAPGQ